MTSPKYPLLQDAALMRRLYLEHELTLVTIGTMVGGASKQVVARHLRAHGIPVRHTGPQAGGESRARR